MSSSPPPSNPLKRPSLSSSSSQPLGSNPKRPRNHPLRQTSFPTAAGPDSRTFSAASDGGSVTGSFTGSLGGASADGIFSSAARTRKRGRKSKAEKEREREDTASVRGGLEARFGSVEGDVPAGSVRGGHAGQAGDEEGEDDDEDEGELLGREEGVTDVEAEKKNLAYV